MTDPKEIVRVGYDALSYRYRADDAPDGPYAPWLQDLNDRLPPQSAILDVGCGNGVPVARYLTAAGHRVTGVDLSEVQIDRARRLVSGATFIRADAADVDFPTGSFDAVVSFYALIHMPRHEQITLVERICRWLRPGGWFVATVGHRDWTGTEDDWLGGETRMWWSHPDAAVYRQWLADAGLVIDHDEFVPEGDGGHTLIRAHRP